ncbi:nucleotide disphospho-sugar-binding domain-containing protein, partial [Streptomyces sp. NPDC091204]|uniref:nucleotide disphospho-sugar-binding domain-containing protein n=1 Tax=Streptomyces sp. NPDC091204 TaxID=3155299 RepID=UPI003429A9AE
LPARIYAGPRMRGLRAPQGRSSTSAPDHGGAGTTTTAAGAGTPQVVLPQGGDAPYWGGRVADLGIGTAHDGPTPTTASAHDGLTPTTASLSLAPETALTPRTRARAAAVAATIRTDGARVAAKLLLDTAG